MSVKFSFTRNFWQPYGRYVSRNRGAMGSDCRALSDEATFTGSVACFCGAIPSWCFRIRISGAAELASCGRRFRHAARSGAAQVSPCEHPEVSWLTMCRGGGTKLTVTGSKARPTALAITDLDLEEIPRSRHLDTRRNTVGKGRYDVRGNACPPTERCLGTMKERISDLTGWHKPLVTGPPARRLYGDEKGDGDREKYREVTRPARSF